MPWPLTSVAQVQFPCRPLRWFVVTRTACGFPFPLVSCQSNTALRLLSAATSSISYYNFYFNYCRIKFKLKTILIELNLQTSLISPVKLVWQINCNFTNKIQDFYDPCKAWQMHRDHFVHLAVESSFDEWNGLWLFHTCVLMEMFTCMIQYILQTVTQTSLKLLVTTSVKSAQRSWSILFRFFVFILKCRHRKGNTRVWRNTFVVIKIMEAMSTWKCNNFCQSVFPILSP